MATHEERIQELRFDALYYDELHEVVPAQDAERLAQALDLAESHLRLLCLAPTVRAVAGETLHGVIGRIREITGAA